MLEAECALALKSWLKTNGGNFHQDAIYSEDDFGYRIIAAKEIPADALVVSCPANLMITPESSRKSILEIFGKLSDLVEKTSYWVDRQWIATYLSLHWIIEKHGMLNHTHYLNMLPTPEKLRTPLHFSSSELTLFQGSNLYGATIDRERLWRNEWENCRNVVAEGDPIWGNKYTWFYSSFSPNGHPLIALCREKYLTAATYISSRAFTSLLLSAAPKQAQEGTACPILIPGVDSLNHARAHPVSWVISPSNEDAFNDQGHTVTIVRHTATAQGEEIFNNYGPKPNAELILGYGFSLPHNPDDTIVLKLGGFEGNKWEIGREAYDAEGLWQEILSSFRTSKGGEPTYEDILDAAASLQEMTELLLERLPQSIPESHSARPEVVEMFHHYIDGQRDILSSLLQFACEREKEAIKLALEGGVELILEN